MVSVATSKFARSPTATHWEVAQVSNVALLKTNTAHRRPLQSIVERLVADSVERDLPQPLSERLRHSRVEMPQHHCFSLAD